MSSVRPSASRNCADTVRTTRLFHLFVFFVALALPWAAFAVDVNAPKPSPVTPANPVNLMLGIGFLFALVIGAWWLARRAGTLQWSTQRMAMKTVASLAVGPRERVVLIEIAGEQWLLGVAPGQVNLLHKFDEPVIAGSDNQEFAARLRQVLQHGLGRQK